MYTDWDQVPLLMTVEEVCILLRWSEQTVRRRINDGTLRAVTVSKAFRIEKQSVMDLIDKERCSIC